MQIKLYLNNKEISDNLVVTFFDVKSGTLKINLKKEISSLLESKTENLSKFITPEQVEFSKVWNLDIRKFLPISLAENLEKVLTIVIDNTESSVDKSLETLLTQFKKFIPAEDILRLKSIFVNKPELLRVELRQKFLRNLVDNDSRLKNYISALLADFLNFRSIKTAEDLVTLHSKPIKDLAILMLEEIDEMKNRKGCASCMLNTITKKYMTLLIELKTYAN
jgi:hypothetical protein